jgi:hypothetical protein
MASPVEFSDHWLPGKKRSVEQTTVEGRVKRLVKAKGVVENRCSLIGDSIIQFVEECRYTSLQSIPGLYAKDLEGVIRRGGITVANFRALIFFCGTNDLTRVSFQEIVGYFESLIWYTRSINPLARIAIAGILPRPCDEGDDTMIKKRVSANNAISHLCRRINVQYIKSEICLKDAGPTSVVYRPDKIHLEKPAVRRLQSYLEGRFSSLLGMPPQWVPFPSNRH